MRHQCRQSGAVFRPRRPQRHGISSKVSSGWRGRATHWLNRRGANTNAQTGVLGSSIAVTSRARLVTGCMQCFEPWATSYDGYSGQSTVRAWGPFFGSCRWGWSGQSGATWPNHSYESAPQEFMKWRRIDQLGFLRDASFDGNRVRRYSRRE